MRVAEPILLLLLLGGVALAAQRQALLRLRDDGIINDDAQRQVERDLDLEAVRGGTVTGIVTRARRSRCYASSP